MEHTTSELLSIGPGNGHNEVIANIVFVHGLGGHNRETWQANAKDDTTFWPQWLSEDLNRPNNSMVPPVGVWSLGYPAEMFQVMFFSKDRTDSIPQRSRNLGDMLVNQGLAQRPIVFVTHSLGGILVKQMLRSARDAGNPRRGDLPKLALSTHLVMFLATPHTGSAMARLAETLPAATSMVLSGLISTVGWLPIGPLVKWLAKRAVQRGRFTKALERGDPYLEDLAAWYRNNASEIGVQTRAYYENAPVLGMVVVDAIGGNPGVSGVEAIPLDADHFSICKPKDKDSEHYKRLAGPIKEAIKDCPAFTESHLAVLDVGERFKRLAELTPADRMAATKKVVHPIEVRLGRSTPVEYESSFSAKGKFVLAPWQEEWAARSPFDLDRIILNLWHEYQGGISTSDSTGALRHETELLRATGLDNRKELTLIPLYYAARALKTQKERGNVQLRDHAVTDAKAALSLVETLASRFGMDDDRSTRNTLGGLLNAT